ncbi:MAG: HNH endonuclease [Pyrinomonadaceae bacterium]
MIKSYIGITDTDWFELLKSKPEIDEVNFWKPGGKTNFRVLQPGELFLFKLHSPNNFIVGGGIFAHFSILPISIAWEAFGEKNGASSYSAMRERVEKYRRLKESRYDDYSIGCILLEQPFFFEREEWIPVPEDFRLNIVQGKSYDLSVQPGKQLWEEIQIRRYPRLGVPAAKPAFGEPVIIEPRLGQGTFRVAVIDGYERRCAFSGERTLPALDAAHIKPFEIVKEHRRDNGLLLRKDLHALFDRGYITVSPDTRIEVSKRIREEFENGRAYYELHGKEIRKPKDLTMVPESSFLQWHNENVFRG